MYCSNRKLSELKMFVNLSLNYGGCGTSYCYLLFVVELLFDYFKQAFRLCKKAVTKMNSRLSEVLTLNAETSLN